MSTFKPTYLYIKQHSITGKMYLGKTVSNPENYYGSGKHWVNHIKKHGKEHVVNLWYCSFFEEKECIETAILLSTICNIVISDNWANYIIETTLDGGSTPKEGNGMYGKKQTPEHIEKRITKESVEKMRTSMIRRISENGPHIPTFEEREQISKTLKQKYKTGELIPYWKGITGEDNPNYGKKRPDHSRFMKEWVKNNHPMQGKTHKDETKQKWKDSGRNCGEKNGLYGKRGDDNPNYGKKRPKEVLDKMKATREKNKKPPIIVACPYCGKVGNVAIMTRWHFDNCKLKEETLLQLDCS